MKRFLPYALIGGSLLAIGLAVWALQDSTIAVLDTQGDIARRQRDLLLFATVLSLIVIVPVFALTIGIAWRYREKNQHSTYTPEWDHDRKLETLWWGIPVIIIAILSVVTWVTSHSLDPFKPIASDKKPITVQVVALQWKWLFIYPDHQIATVNYLKVPEDTPINFRITAQAPMNSFWIPQLGGQIYAMEGMETQLHLIANNPGSYSGVSANISGEGFADMRFTLDAVSEQDFSTWTGTVAGTGDPFDIPAYEALAQPSRKQAVKQFALMDDTIFDHVLAKYSSSNTSKIEYTESNDMSHMEGH